MPGTGSVRGRRPNALVAAAVAAVCLLAPACGRDPEVLTQQYLAEGHALLRDKQYSDAIIQYRNAVGASPKSGEAHQALAEAYAAAGNMRQAFPEFIQAADLLPGNIDLQLKAGRLLFNGGMFAEARSRARAILQQDPNHVDGLLLLGNALAGLKNLDDAVNVVQRAVGIDPERAGVYTNLAVLQLAQQNLDEAEQTFLKAAALNESPQSLLALANFYRAVRRAPEAERTLTRAYALAPEDVVVNRTLASFYVESGRGRQAEAFYLRVAKIRGDPPSRVALASYYVSQRRFTEAIAILQEVAADPKQYAAATTQIALVQYVTGQPQQALRTIDRVLERDARSVDALTTKARLLLAGNRPHDALVEINDALRINPDHAGAHLTLGRVHLALQDQEAARQSFLQVTKLEPDSLPGLLELSDIHRRRNEIDSAIGFADLALASHRDSLPARLALVRALMVRGDSRLAGEIQRLTSGYPRSADVHSTLGADAMRRKDAAGARRHFERALQLDPVSTEGLAGLLALDLSAQRATDARRRIERVLAAYPSAQIPRVLAARVYMLTGDPSRAEAALKDMLRADPGNPEVYGRLAEVYLTRGELDQAQREFEEMIRLDPKSVGAHTMLGLLAYVRKDYPEARRSWEAALRIDSGAAAAANNLAWLYAETGTELVTAAQLAAVALSKFPNLPEVHDTLGWAYYRQGLPLIAIPYFERSIDIDGTNPLYHFHLGMAHAKQGDDGKARRSLERALALNTAFDGADEARSTLRGLVY